MKKVLIAGLLILMAPLLSPAEDAKTMTDDEEWVFRHMRQTAPLTKPEVRRLYRLIGQREESLKPHHYVEYTTTVIEEGPEALGHPTDLRSDVHADRNKVWVKNGHERREYSDRVVITWQGDAVYKYDPATDRYTREPVADCSEKTEADHTRWESATDDGTDISYQGMGVQEGQQCAIFLLRFAEYNSTTRTWMSPEWGYALRDELVGPSVGGRSIVTVFEKHQFNFAEEVPDSLFEVPPEKVVISPDDQSSPLASAGKPCTGSENRRRSK